MRVALLVLGIVAGVASAAEERRKIFVASSVAGSKQPCYLILPEGLDREGPPVPLLVSLHTWSGNVEQRDLEMEAEAGRRGWICLWPDFRGPNNSPDACGSEKAQQDILDVVDWVLDRYAVDKKRLYLTGASGGGHMTMLMAGRHPERWAAARAWVGISDLAARHARHAEAQYGEMLRNCRGGFPGFSVVFANIRHLCGE